MKWLLKLGLLARTPISLLNPWLLLAVAAAFSAVAWYAYSAGLKSARTSCEADKGKVASATLRIERNDQDYGFKLGAEQEQDREQIRIVYQTITKWRERVVEKPVYRDCLLDDDGLRAWNAANGGRVPDAAGEPDDAVPGAAAARKKDAGSRDAKPRRSDPPVSRVQSQARPPGTLGNGGAEK